MEILWPQFELQGTSSFRQPPPLLLLFGAKYGNEKQWFAFGYFAKDSRNKMALDICYLLLLLLGTGWATVELSLWQFRGYIKKVSTLVHVSKCAQKSLCGTLKKSFLERFSLNHCDTCYIVQCVLIIFSAFYYDKAFSVIAPISWVISPLLSLQPPHPTPNNKHMPIQDLLSKTCGTFVQRCHEKHARPTVSSSRFFTGCTAGRTSHHTSL